MLAPVVARGSVGGSNVGVHADLVRAKKRAASSTVLRSPMPVSTDGSNTL